MNTKRKILVTAYIIFITITHAQDQESMVNDLDTFFNA